LQLTVLLQISELFSGERDIVEGLNIVFLQGFLFSKHADHYCSKEKLLHDQFSRLELTC